MCSEEHEGNAKLFIEENYSASLKLSLVVTRSFGVIIIYNNFTIKYIYLVGGIT